MGHKQPNPLHGLQNMAIESSRGALTLKSSLTLLEPPLGSCNNQQKKVDKGFVW